ncbi:MAG: amidohydrolase family protein [Magnetococcales bacterium]|nr:amidohydrolase family protein [Magnetococcales bacterium]
MNPTRRTLLTGLTALFGSLAAGCALPRLWNPCHPRLPDSLAHHPLVTAAWEGIDPAQVWDCHAHIAGIGDSGSGIVLSPQMSSLFHPIQFMQRRFYLNAGCVQETPGRVDQSYVERLRTLIDDLRPGAKMMLFAFDRAHDASGRPLPEQSTFYVPNDYARSLASAYPRHFEWVASIHPARRDALAALEQAKEHGAQAVKWLPPAMGIDPADPVCQPFYQALARLDLPLITHGGEEKAVHGIGKPEFGNPLRLRRALDSGVRTIVAHCASIGTDHDTDHGDQPISSFALFTRMMEHPDHRELLFGDLSAITLRNRDPEVVRTLLKRQEWHGRLLNGTDYPLPGILPLISPAALAQAGLLHETAVPVLKELQTYNALLFDLVLKRQLSAHGARLATRVFETRRFFTRKQS